MVVDTSGQFSTITAPTDGSGNNWTETLLFASAGHELLDIGYGADGTLYGVTANGDAGALVSIDPSTGARTFLSSYVSQIFFANNERFQANSLAFDSTGSAYVGGVVDYASATVLAERYPGQIYHHDLQSGIWSLWTQLDAWGDDTKTYLPSGDLVFKNGFLYIAVQSGPGENALWRFTFDDSRDPVAMEIVGQLPEDTWGLATGSSGELLIVTDLGLFSIREDALAVPATAPDQALDVALLASASDLGEFIPTFWLGSSGTYEAIYDDRGTCFDLALSAETRSAVDSHYVGGAIDYRLTLSNLSQQPRVGDQVVLDGTGIRLSHQIPDGFEVISAGATTGSFDADGGHWDLALLASGQSASLDISLRPTLAGSFAFLGEVAAVDQAESNSTPGNARTHSDPDSGEDDEFEFALNVAGSTDLYIAMETSAAPHYLEDGVTLTYSVGNNGPIAADNIVVATGLPQNFVIQSTNGEDGATFNPTTNSFDIATLDVDSTVELMVVAVPPGLGSVDIAAQVSSGTQEGAAGNNATSTQFTVLPQADLLLALALSPDPVAVGQPATLTVTIDNDGPSPVSDGAVTLSIPDGYALVSTQPDTYDTMNERWALGALGVDEQATFTAQLSTLATGEYNATATVQSVEHDPDTANNQALTNNGNEPRIDLNLVAALTQTELGVGGQALLQLDLENDGLSQATNLAVEVTLPQGLALASVESIESPAASYDDSAGVWQISVLNSTQKTTLTLRLDVLHDYRYEISAEVVQADQVDNDSSPANGVQNAADNLAEDDEASVSPARILYPELDVQTIATPLANAQAGDTVTLASMITNNGNGAALGVTVSDTLVQIANNQAIALSGTAACMDDNDTSFDAIAGGRINPGATVVCERTYLLTEQDSIGTLAFSTDTVVGLATTQDGQPVQRSGTSNIGSALVGANQGLDLSIVPTSNLETPLSVDDPLRFTVVVSNVTNQIQSDVALTLGRDTASFASDCPAQDLVPLGSMTCLISDTVTAADLAMGTYYSGMSAQSGDASAMVSDSLTLSLPATAGASIPGINLEYQVAGFATNGDIALNRSVDVGDTVDLAISITNTGLGSLTQLDLTLDGLATSTCLDGLPSTLAAGASYSCLDQKIITAQDIAAVSTFAVTPAQVTANTSNTDDGMVVADVDLARLLPTPGPTLNLDVLPLPANGIYGGDTIAYAVRYTNSGDTRAQDVSVQFSPTAVAHTCDDITTLAVDQIVYCTAIVANAADGLTYQDVDMNVTVTALNQAGGSVSPAQKTVTTGVLANGKSRATDQTIQVSASQRTFDDADQSNTITVGDSLVFSVNLTNHGLSALSDLGLSTDGIGTLGCETALASQTLAPGVSTVCTLSVVVDDSMVSGLNGALGAASGRLDIALNASGQTQDVGSSGMNTVKGQGALSLLVDDAAWPRIGAAALSFDAVQLGAPSPDAVTIDDALDLTFSIINVGNVALNALSLDVPWLARGADALSCAPTLDAGLAVGAMTQCTATMQVDKSLVDLTSGQINLSAILTASASGAALSNDITVSQGVRLLIGEAPAIETKLFSLPTEQAEQGNMAVFSIIAQHSDKSYGNASRVQIMDTTTAQPGTPLDADSCRLYSGDNQNTANARGAGVAWLNDATEGLANDGAYVECLVAMLVSDDMVNAGDQTLGVLTSFHDSVGSDLASRAVSHSFASYASDPDNAVNFTVQVSGAPTNQSVTDMMAMKMTPAVGETLVFDATVTNLSSSTLVRWSLVSNLSRGSWTCDNQDLGVGASAQCTYSFEVDAYTMNADAIEARFSLVGELEQTAQSFTQTRILHLPTDEQSFVPGLIVSAAPVLENALPSNGVTVGMGDVVTYGITLYNNGLTDLSDVNINAPSLGAVDCGDHDLSLVAGGTTVQCTASQTIQASDFQTNHGSNLLAHSIVASGQSLQGISMTAQSAASVEVVGFPELDMQLQTIPNAMVEPGDTVVVLATIANSGTATAMDVQVGDAGQAVECQAETQGGQVFDLSSDNGLAALDSVQCSLLVTVPQGATGSHDIPVTISALDPKAVGDTKRIEHNENASVTVVQDQSTQSPGGLRVLSLVSQIDKTNRQISVQSRIVNQGVTPIYGLDLSANNALGLSCDANHPLPVAEFEPGKVLSCSATMAYDDQDVEAGFVQFSTAFEASSSADLAAASNVDLTASDLITVPLGDMAVPSLGLETWLDSYEDLDNNNAPSVGDLARFVTWGMNLGGVDIDDLTLNVQLLYETLPFNAGAALVPQCTPDLSSGLAAGTSMMCVTELTFPEPAASVGSSASPGLASNMATLSGGFALQVQAQAPGLVWGGQTMTLANQNTVAMALLPSDLAIGIAKELVALEYDTTTPNRVEMTFDFLVQNYSPTGSLLDVQITDDIGTLLAGRWQAIEVLSCPQNVGSGVLTPNCAYSAQGANISILSGSDTLTAGQSDRLRLEVAVTLTDSGAVSFMNQATATGRGSANQQISDLSHSGGNPDPNGDGNPDEQTPTQIDIDYPKQFIEMTLVALKPTATIGMPVAILSTAQNLTAQSVTISVHDIMPPGFNYVPITALVAQQGMDTAQIEPVTSGLNLRWDNITLQPFGAAQVQVLMTPGIGLNAGNYVAQSCATANAVAQGVCVSNMATTVIEVVEGASFGCSSVMGRVALDQDRDGYAGAVEPGIPGVRLGTPTGLIIHADPNGQYSIPCARTPKTAFGENFAIKLDTQSLPDGYRVTSANPAVVRLTPGMVTTVDFAVAEQCKVNVRLTEAAFAPGSTGLLGYWQQPLANAVNAAVVQPFGPCRLEIVLAGRDGSFTTLNRARIDQVKDTATQYWQTLSTAPVAVDTMLVITR